jgi:biopolymer transport protein ExbD
MQPLRRRFRYQAVKAPIDAPMSELNITPLIDVLLVLLVMLMITIPISTHKVEVDLPIAGPGAIKLPPINTLHLSAAGATTWNGKSLTGDDLKANLRSMASDPSKPQLRLQTDASASYDDFDHLIATVKRSGVQKLSFVGNKQYTGWER